MTSSALVSVNGIAVLPASNSSTDSRHSLTHIVVLTNERTNSSEATIGCTRGTGSQSTDGGKQDILHLYRRCSTHCRRCRTTCLACAATVAGANRLNILLVED